MSTAGAPACIGVCVAGSSGDIDSDVATAAGAPGLCSSHLCIHQHEARLLFLVAPAAPISTTNASGKTAFIWVRLLQHAAASKAVRKQLLELIDIDFYLRFTRAAVTLYRTKGPTFRFQPPCLAFLREVLLTRRLRARQIDQVKGLPSWACCGHFSSSRATSPTAAPSMPPRGPALPLCYF